MKKYSQRFTNEAKEQYLGLAKQGYYIRPEKYDNTVVCSITKNLNSEGTERTTFGEVNMEMAKILADEFGFRIVPEVPYFGKEQPIPRFEIRYQAESEVTNLLS